MAPNLKETCEMYAHAHLKCPEHGQEYWIATVKVTEDADVKVLGYAFGPTDAEIEAVARVMFDTTTSAAHVWETIADPGRDLWRHNARMALLAARAAQ